MVEEKGTYDMEELKKELAAIKGELMRKELEEIKREKMRQELEEIKAEQALMQVAQVKPRLSIATVLMAFLTLVIAGYMLGTLFPYNLAGDIDGYISEYGYPISGSMVVAIVSIVLIFIGLGFVTMAKK